MIVSNHNCHHQNQAASSLVCSVILRNIYASLCYENSRYSISFGCCRGVHCIGCIADQLYRGPDSCECQGHYFLCLFTQTVYRCNTFIFVCESIYDCRDQKESSSPRVDFSSNYGNTELHKPTAVPRIPRANPDASWKSNNLEMTNSGSNQALVVRDRPDSKEVRTFITV